jgi:hypothetical protein
MTTIDLIDNFCRQSIIGIDPIDVFFTIGAQLCKKVMSGTAVEHKIWKHFLNITNYTFFGAVDFFIGTATYGIGKKVMS